jgi:predicted transcriptional regulator
MRKYRSRLDIAAEILKVAQVNSGVNKTKIMYSVFLSFPQLKEYLAFLLENQLLEGVTENKNLYRTTEKGKRFLNNYREMNSMLFPSSTKEKTIRKAEG